MLRILPEEGAKTIVGFCRFARQQGLSGGVQETLGALRAVASLGIGHRDDLKSGLRSVMCSCKEEWDLFDEIFDTFWSEVELKRSASKRPLPRNEGTAASSEKQRSDSLLSGAHAGEALDKEGRQAVAGASARERLCKADFSTLRQDDLLALEQLALRLLKLMSVRLSRRRRIANSRGTVDLRRTIRSSVSRGGNPVDLQYQNRKPRPRRLVVLLDISGSMSPYSLFLVRFIYALQRHFKQVDTFLFSTDLVEVTKVLQGRRLPQALQALSGIATGWSGGTKIGASLRDFNYRHRRKLVGSDTFFMILSDGWDTGEPEVLAAELAQIKRRVRKLIWLNPLLGLADYRPVTQGLSAALPHVDVFAPAHNLESLLALEKHL